jgi:Fe-S-cluster-containing dehydrogenase component
MKEKKHWKSIEEYNILSTVDGPQSIDDSQQLSVISGQTSEDITESSEQQTPGYFSRRDFLKASGFGLATVAFALSGCENVINKAIPYLIKPEGVIPGIADYFASTYFDGHDYCSILVKTREGRPVKIEGNALSNISSGGTNARVQASVLSLYDDSRLKAPMKQSTVNGRQTTEKISWEMVDSEIGDALSVMAATGGKIVILTSTVISPSTKSVFKDFIKKFPSAEVITYDAVSSSGMLEANKITFGEETLPTYNFSKADLIVSFGADFLGTWIAPIEFTRQYAGRRNISKENTNISKHVQFESTLSLTGSNADIRIPINPSEEGRILTELYQSIAGKSLAGFENLRGLHGDNTKFGISELAKELLAKKGKCLVVSGSNETGIQILVNRINYLLGNYGNTVDIEHPTYYRHGIDSKMWELVERMEKEEIQGIFLYNVNPAYDYPKADKFIKALAKTTLSVSFSDTMDETAKLVNYVCPDSHYLESWNDAEPLQGSFSFCQPVINKLFDTRQAQESLLIWSGVINSSDPATNNFQHYIQKYWEGNIYPSQTGYHSFKEFWNSSLQNGVFESRSQKSEVRGQKSEVGSLKHEFLLSENDFSKTVNGIIGRKVDGYEYVLYENIGIGTGKHANNPWLQELPDPVSKVCWDNYLAISYELANRLNLKLGDIVKFQVSGSKFQVSNKAQQTSNVELELPILIQPGQAENTVAIALGYGRTSAGKVAKGVGKNAYALVSSSKFKVQSESKNRIYSGSGIKIKPTGVNYIFALTQTHHSMEGRPLIRQGNLSEYKTNPYAGNERHLEDVKKNVTIYKKREFKGHHWGLVIDLNKCTGCSACVIACQAENNVPVIGRDEVRKRRIMHWIRIDRYYSENPVIPDVNFQPVFCQHCNNAPCENVCPVEATQNSKEGINEMAYNRCVGTKYCINNCPYHVRRFNWLAYNSNDEISSVHYDLSASSLSKMQLNPDVIVRSRGVVEKCTLCIQRIQEIKLLAKKENREIADGEIKPACLQACPAGAMIFGDQSVPESMVNKSLADERKYFLLEQLNTVPAVGFLTKIKNDT